MTVTRSPATTLDDVKSAGCYKCGGPHFHKNRRNSASPKLVSQSAVPAAAAPGLNLIQPTAARSYAAAVHRKLSPKDSDPLLKLECRVIAFLRAFHDAHFACDGKCQCLAALCDTPKTAPAAAAAPSPVFIASPAQIGQVPAAAAAPKIPASSKTQAETKIDYPSSPVVVAAPSSLHSLPLAPWSPLLLLPLTLSAQRLFPSPTLQPRLLYMLLLLQARLCRRKLTSHYSHLLL
jgi:hypothetical protein